MRGTSLKEYFILFLIFALPISFGLLVAYANIQNYNRCNEGDMGACIAFYRSTN